LRTRSITDVLVATTPAGTLPGHLAEVAHAAGDLDGVRQLVPTSAASTGRDRGAPPRALRRRGPRGAAREEAWAESVLIFGRNRVCTYLLIGRGEDPDELVAGARRLIAMGVYPFVVPYRPLEGRLRTPSGCRHRTPHHPRTHATPRGAGVRSKGATSAIAMPPRQRHVITRSS